jgi:hypothetical protein
MSATVIALVLWLVLILASIWVWIPDRGRARPLTSRTPVLVAVVATEVVVTAVVALLAGLGPPLAPPASWFAVGLAGLAALLSGGAVAFALLALVDAFSAKTSGARVQRTVLRGGAWIGALERLALFGTVVAGWPEGIVAIVAVKAFARYPELKTGQATGAIERFIIGTFSSLGWAGVCAGMAMIFR